jgi:hypothetical protein
MGKKLILTLALALLTGCYNPLSIDDCYFRIAVLPGETETQAIRSTIPDRIREQCIKDAGNLKVWLVYVLGEEQFYLWTMEDETN